MEKQDYFEARSRFLKIASGSGLALLGLFFILLLFFSLGSMYALLLLVHVSGFVLTAHQILVGIPSLIILILSLSLKGLRILAVPSIAVKILPFYLIANVVFDWDLWPSIQEFSFLFLVAGAIIIDSLLCFAISGKLFPKLKKDF